jgi:hypothetical protein
MKIVLAASPKWWVGLSEKEQEEYIKEHPNSKMAKSHPLFNMAKNAENTKYALNHPLAGKIQDEFGNTPLHYMTEYSPEARKHPQANLTANKKGLTPAQYYDQTVKRAFSPSWNK